MSALLTDLYQLTMMQAYLDEGPAAMPYPVDICAGIRELARRIDAARNAG